MGCGKTEAINAAVKPLLDVGTPLLVISHRKALGQALSERLGVPWTPRHGSDERLQGAGFCLDSACPNSHMHINGSAWNGGVLVLDEWMQAVEHLLFSTETAIKDRRAAVLRTLTELLLRQSQVIAADAQLADWGVNLLERLTGKRGLLIRSEHQPMLGRPLHCPKGLTTPKAAGEAFRAKWAELVDEGKTFLCFTTAQKADEKNAPQNLAELHLRYRPESRVLVIDSSTPEAAAALAADPDGVAKRFDAVYVSPSISSGVSFQRWRPDAVIALSAGGQIAPEHVAQVVARVRCPNVPAWIYAPEKAPGKALRVGSGATRPDQLIGDLRAVSDPLYGQLNDADADGIWLKAWADLGAQRNRQRFAYRATIAGLLEQEGWELQVPSAAPPRDVTVTIELGAITNAAKAAADKTVVNASVITPEAAAELSKHHRLNAAEQAALDRHQIASRWGLAADADLSIELLEADRDGLREKLKTGWLLTTPGGADLVPEVSQRDHAAITALDPDEARPFAPDRQRVTIGGKLLALAALKLPALLQRFAAGEVISANDQAVVALHANATTYRRQLVAATGVSPGKKTTGTLRSLLKAMGWALIQEGRVKARGAERDTYTYTAAPMALPVGVKLQALTAVWMTELQSRPTGAKSDPIGIFHRVKKSPTPSLTPGFRALQHQLRSTSSPGPAEPPREQAVPSPPGCSGSRPRPVSPSPGKKKLVAGQAERLRPRWHDQLKVSAAPKEASRPLAEVEEYLRWPAHLETGLMRLEKRVREALEPLHQLDGLISRQLREIDDPLQCVREGLRRPWAELEDRISQINGSKMKAFLASVEAV